MINLLISLCAFVSMEAIVWLTHKYIMHGLLWVLHKDHRKIDTYGFFERNDFFFLIFAIPGMVGLLIGMQSDFNFHFWIGLGITIYGFTYFLVHDNFIHQRFNTLRNIDNITLKLFAEHIKCITNI